ncbi:hypothetical protein HNS38_00775 [Lentimicrobium sp. L6]|uniref:alginate O-acetyltransferase AlgX-related protein n=1 Tax=Lentimicrobium sp. L6 TaxID=2735916 RepID=UPI001552522E|nr:hypothetical protein [Lentimicrobium sp. L6]NPD83270.1 hypothetical protein [Lentimicrobium sp. L6]
MKNKTKNIGIIIIILALTLPLLQYYTQKVFVKPLEGSYTLKQKPVFIIQDWFSGEFQNKYDTFFNDHFGFRSSFVRLYNQLQYSLFNKVSAQNVIIGKNDYLYEQQYIDSYFGTNFIGEKKINSRINKLLAIQEELKKHQTQLIIVIAPGKGFFYPEFIPDSMNKERSITNYEVYTSILTKSNIPFIDFNAAFLNMKDGSEIVLYPKTGIHWSQGSMPLIVDSILRKMELVLNKNLVDVQIDDISKSFIADKQDSDIEKALNLGLPVPIPLMTYPQISFKDESAYKPKVISIADSFFWQLYRLGIHQKAFSHGEFWYYNQQIFIDKLQMTDEVKNINYSEAIRKADILLLFTTEANLDRFPFGFIESFEHASQNYINLEKDIRAMMKQIQSDKKWFEKIQEKAKSRGITVDSMLYLDAKFMIDQKYK